MALLVCALVPRAALAQSTDPTTGSVIFAGDVLPHRAVLDALRAHGEGSLFAPVARVVRGADVALINMDSPVSSSAPVPGVGRRFNAPPELLRAMVDVGFDGISAANNHAYDAGLAGVAETIGAMRSAGIVPLGAAMPGEDLFAPSRFPLAGASLCVFAATRVLNEWVPSPRPDRPRVLLARPEVPHEENAFLRAIRRHKPGCGAVLVSLHAGAEYRDAPSRVDRAFFRRVAEAGADVVIGHHPHTPQPVELLTVGSREVPVFYSLGNFVSGQGTRAEANRDPYGRGAWDRTYDARVREGLLAVMRFRAAGAGRLVLASWGYVPVWTENSRLRARRGEVPRVAASLMPRGGGDVAFMRRRWVLLVRRVGGAYVASERDVPAAGGP